MAKKKLLEDISRAPGRFYRAPGDVLRDRRFNDAERREILLAWREQAPDQLPAIAAAIDELQNRGGLHAAE